MARKKKNPFEKEINQQITRKCKTVRVVGNEEIKGIMTSYEAYKKAQELELDLVLMSSKGDTHICRIMDYPKYLYDAAKKAKASKGTQKKLKTIQLGLDIESHDINTKMNEAIKFLKKKHKVKITLRIKGWLNMKRSAGGGKVIRDFVDLINAQDLDFIVSFDSKPTFQGRNWSSMVSQKPKKKNGK